MNEREICTACGEALPGDQLVEFDGQLLCPSCLRETAVLCDHCGDRIWQSESVSDNTTTLCQSCFDRHYVSCSDCGSIIHVGDACYPDDDEDEPYCRSCLSRQGYHKTIHDYYYRPDPIFYGTGPRFMGVELEIDEGGENDRKAGLILDSATANGLEHLYIKHDGSLDDGLELVSHPMTLDYHLKEMPWKGILSKCRELGYVSHLANTCGLHVHISRATFGMTEDEQDKCIARVLYFFEKFWEELLKFSRRTPRQLDRWAARYGYKEQPQDILDHAKKGNVGRYTCVNLTNTDTIEFRMFRGTLKLNTLIATLQLLDRVCDVALSLSDEEVKAMSWTTFVSGCQAPELVQYLKERRLYVNEPVADLEGEV